MLHAFDVVMNNALVQSEQPKKIGKKLVPPRNISRHGFAGGCQDKAAILFVFEQTFGIEPLYHVGDARLGNFQARSDIDYAGVAL